MKPDGDKMLGLLAQALTLEIAPDLRHDYGQRNALLMAMLLSSAAEEWDRAAARRVEENRALRELFAEAASEVTSQPLQERLRSAAQDSDKNLRVSELERANEVLRSLLIELHAHVEELDSPGGRRIEARIWEELRRSTERRALAFAPF
jgi:hypothetical protein